MRTPGEPVAGLTAHTFTGQALDPDTGLMYYRARWYDPRLGRFISADTVVPEPGNPQALNRYVYVLNNPLRYNDPSGHCPWCITIGVGALIGAGLSYGTQVAVNISQNGLSVQAFTDVNWAQVGAGAVAGAVGGATFGLGTAVLGTGLAGTVVAGAVSGAVAGQAAIATENVLSGREMTAGLGDPVQIATDAVLGGVLAGVGYAAESAGTAITWVNREVPEGAQLIARWGPLTGEGPLGSEIANAFRGGSYSEILLTEDTVFYRVYGGNAQQLSSWWTRVQPQGPLQARIDLALLPEWGNTAEGVVSIVRSS